MAEQNNKNNKKNNNDEELTIKEASSKLDISEATVRKYLKDFELSIEKGTGSKAIISDETFQALSEIVKLRANGLSIQEIKELKTQKPSKNILEEIEEDESTKEKEEPVLSNAKSESPNVSEQEEPDDLFEEKSLNEENLPESPIDSEVADVKSSEDTEEQKGDQLGEEQDGEEGQEGQRRRRGFNYRYVERQISNDAKRISSFRRRLQNPNIPIQEKLFFEEALERRILFLNGWKHILRWVSKR